MGLSSKEACLEERYCSLWLADCIGQEDSSLGLVNGFERKCCRLRLAHRTEQRWICLWLAKGLAPDNPNLRLVWSIEQVGRLQFAAGAWLWT